MTSFLLLLLTLLPLSTVVDEDAQLELRIELRLLEEVEVKESNPDDRLDAEDIVDLLKDLDAKSKATSNLIDPPCEELA